MRGQKSQLPEVNQLALRKFFERQQRLPLYLA